MWILKRSENYKSEQRLDIDQLNYKFLVNFHFCNFHLIWRYTQSTPRNLIGRLVIHCCLCLLCLSLNNCRIVIDHTVLFYKYPDLKCWLDDLKEYTNNNERSLNCWVRWTPLLPNIHQRFDPSQNVIKTNQLQSNIPLLHRNDKGCDQSLVQILWSIWWTN